MPTVEPSKEQREEQRRAPPQKDPRAIETHGKRNPNADNLTDSATLERIQKSHLGSSKDEHRKANAPSAEEQVTTTSPFKMPTEDPKKPEQPPAPAAAAQPPKAQWTPIKPPTTGPATRCYGFIDPGIKNPTSPSNSTEIERCDS